jgi:hypothetical protein
LRSAGVRGRTGLKLCNSTDEHPRLAALLDCCQKIFEV